MESVKPKYSLPENAGLNVDAHVCNPYGVGGSVGPPSMPGSHPNNFYKILYEFITMYYTSFLESPYYRLAEMFAVCMYTSPATPPGQGRAKGPPARKVRPVDQGDRHSYEFMTGGLTGRTDIDSYLRYAKPCYTTAEGECNV